MGLEPPLNLFERASKGKQGQGQMNETRRDRDRVIVADHQSAEVTSPRKCSSPDYSDLKARQFASDLVRRMRLLRRVGIIGWMPHRVRRARRALASIVRQGSIGLAAFSDAHVNENAGPIQSPNFSQAGSVSIGTDFPPMLTTASQRSSHGVPSAPNTCNHLLLSWLVSTIERAIP